MNINFAVGDLTIHRIIEQETTFLPALDMLPGLKPDLLAENRPWLRKAAALDESDVLILCFQSYIVKTPHHVILVDSCIGNDKPRPLRPKWNMKTDGAFMGALADAGVSVGDIDYVMCTHLHVDHVGWNTRLENGRWVPTFPNARYVFAKTEFDYWTEQHARAEVAPFGDSVLPVVEAKQAEIVRDNYQIGESCAHFADARPYAGTCRVRLWARQGLRSGQRRPHALAAAGALSRTVSEIRCRSGAGGGDPAQFPGALLRHRNALLHRSFSLAVIGQNPALG
jgi:Metallo-beta-lactamase superfamily